MTRTFQGLQPANLERAQAECNPAQGQKPSITNRTRSANLQVPVEGCASVEWLSTRGVSYEHHSNLYPAELPHNLQHHVFGPRLAASQAAPLLSSSIRHPPIAPLL